MRFKILFTIIILILLTVEIYSQCPICKIAAESNLENGGTAGKGLNSGILYMLTLPYLLIGVIGFVWYRNRRKDDEDLDSPLVVNHSLSE